MICAIDVDFFELDIIVYFCLLLKANELTNGQKKIIKQTVAQSNPKCLMECICVDVQ